MKNFIVALAISLFLVVPLYGENYPFGDLNLDTKISVSDVVYLINYIFAGGPLTPPLPSRGYPDSIVWLQNDTMRIVERPVEDTSWERIEIDNVAFYRQNGLLKVYKHEFYIYKNELLTDKITFPGFTQIAFLSHAWNLADSVLSPNDLEFLLTPQIDSAVTLYWTAPPDEDVVQTQIRYSLQPLTEANWDSAIIAGTVNTTPYRREQFIIRGLTPNTQYYFAVKSVDASGLWSNISNVVMATPVIQQANTPPSSTVIRGD